MTIEEFAQYKLLVRSSYMNYVINLYNRAQSTKLDLKFEFDTKLWILHKAVSIIMLYNMNGNNVFAISEMLHWQTIMNNIMQTRRYVNFEIE